MVKETEITVNDLISIIIEKTSNEDDGILEKEWHKEYLLKRLDFHNGNDHLRNPLNIDPEIYSFVERDKPLIGDEIVSGDFLLYDCVGHDGTELVWKFNSLEEIEAHMLHEVGLSNPFTTHMFLIEFGKYKEFEYDIVNNKITWLS